MKTSLFLTVGLATSTAMLASCSASHQRSTIIEWLARGHDCVTTAGCNEAWMDEGRRISNIESELDTLLARPNREVDLAVATAFLRVEATDASVPVLLESLKSPNELVQVDCALALGRLRSRKAVKPLIELLDTGSIGLRANVARALGEIGGRDVQGILDYHLSMQRFLYKSYQAAYNRVKIVNSTTTRPAEDDVDEDGPF